MSDRLGEKKYDAGSKKSFTRAADKYARASVENRAGAMSWKDAPPEDLMAVIAAVTEDGAAILLSKTSDGGALVVRILTDRGSTPFYPASAGALNDVLMRIVEVAGQA